MLFNDVQPLIVLKEDNNKNDRHFAVVSHRPTRMSVDNWPQQQNRAKFTTQLVLMLVLTITLTLTLTLILTLTLLLTLTNPGPNTNLKLLQCISYAGQ